MLLWKVSHTSLAFTHANILTIDVIWTSNSILTIVLSKSYLFTQANLNIVGSERVCPLYLNTTCWDVLPLHTNIPRGNKLTCMQLRTFLNNWEGRTNQKGTKNSLLRSLLPLLYCPWMKVCSTRLLYSPPGEIISYSGDQPQAHEELLLASQDSTASSPLPTDEGMLH